MFKWIHLEFSWFVQLHYVIVFLNLKYHNISPNSSVIYELSMRYPAHFRRNLLWVKSRIKDFFRFSSEIKCRKNSGSDFFTFIHYWDRRKSLILKCLLVEEIPWVLVVFIRVQLDYRLPNTLLSMIIYAFLFKLVYFIFFQFLKFRLIYYHFLFYNF